MTKKRQHEDAPKKDGSPADENKASTEIRQTATRRRRAPSPGITSW